MKIYPKKLNSTLEKVGVTSQCGKTIIEILKIFILKGYLPTLGYLYPPHTPKSSFIL